MEIQYGWTGKIAKIDLTERKVSYLDTDQYSERFIGGLGIGEKIYWDESSPETEAFDPANPLILMTGPLCATTAPGAPRLVVCGKSPATYPERFVNASIAGFFPAELKKAGYDGIVLQGKTDKPVYVIIDDGTVKIRDAAHLWGLTNSNVRQRIQDELGGNPEIMSIGPGAENGSRIGTLLIDRAGCASMGFGSLMGSKNIKAIVVSGSGKIVVANPDEVKRIRKKLKSMTGPGSHHIFGTPYPVPGNEIVKKVHCHGCPQGCMRTLQRRVSGIEGIRKCQTGTYYAKWDIQLHGKITDVTFLATDLANDYSLCIQELIFLLLWLERCAEKSILSDQKTSLPLSQMGSLEFLEALIEKITLRESFGQVLAEGALRAAEIVGPESRDIVRDFLNQTGRPPRAYGPKTFIISAPVYAIEQRPTVTTLHEICHPLTKWALWYITKGKNNYVSTDVLRKIAERFWGGREAVDFSTYEGKALAAKIIQNREYGKECLVLCDFVWPVLDDASTEDHVGDPTLESQLLSAVIGRDIDEQELYRIGERVFTLNRAIQLRDGRNGRENDILDETCFIERADPPADIFDMNNPELYLPGTGDEIISRKGKAVDRQKFKKLMDEYYELRGWDIQTGLLKKETLQDLDLIEVIESLRDKVV